MRVTPFIVVCLMLVACGDTGEAVECDIATPAVDWRGHHYLAHPTAPPRLSPGRPVEDGRELLPGDDTRPHERFIVQSGSRRPDVAVDTRTRLDGFERAGIPYLQIGDRVRIHGRRCRGDALLARRITPQP